MTSEREPSQAVANTKTSLALHQINLHPSLRPRPCRSNFSSSRCRHAQRVRGKCRPTATGDDHPSAASLKILSARHRSQCGVGKRLSKRISMHPAYARNSAPFRRTPRRSICEASVTRFEEGWLAVRRLRRGEKERWKIFAARRRREGTR